MENGDVNEKILSREERKQINKVACLSIIPGLGQFYNKQIIKGVIFIAIFFLLVCEMIFYGFEALQGLVSLGNIPREDHSLFLLIEGTIQVLIIVIYLIFMVAVMVDARKIAKKRIISPSTVTYSIKATAVSLYENGFPYLLTIPAYLVMILAIVFPVLVTIFIAFTNYNFHNIPPANLVDWVGFETFSSIFTLTTYRDTFFSVFSWTIIWTVAATTLQLIIGVFTALVLNQPHIRFNRFFGVIMLLPWAVPAFITILTFSNIFNPSVGAINTQVIPFFNQLIPFIDIPSISWKVDPFWTKIAIIMIQGWVGYPYIYVLTSGILQSIPKDWYEASVIDGASAIQKFRHITMPHIFAVAAPIFITQYTGNFNNFNLIYLFNEGGPGSIGSGAGSTDILISWIYKLTTGTSPQYNISAAVTLIISAIVITISMVIFSKTRAFEMED
ncbi:arabinogalactan oligomer / maltooligosaccharide transport system permease protein [Amphibacillus marinus]|uniref:Maltose/maltodextrin transport system permease protein n=1 Tax=Amphibacillus marinus TaxID=872970 RepID=A0A1H8MVV0_9BACI|nr:arabinogalactan oligomer / maltooligosaccharide transport system permease protein [Amphibacillus marinus]